MTDALNTAPIAPLLEAGAVLATLAEPSRDLADFGSDLREIALTLKLVGNGLGAAYERVSALFMKPERQAQEERAARATALRTAKRALVDLAVLVNELAGEG